MDGATRQSARLFELRAATDLARLMREQGRLSEAYELKCSLCAFQPMTLSRHSARFALAHEKDRSDPTVGDFAEEIAPRR
jgi:hypothetical protein